MECEHESRLILLDNLKRGKQLGCPLCYKKRNNLVTYKNDNQKLLHSRVKSVILRCTNSKTNGYETYGGRGIEVYGEWIDNPMEMVHYLEKLPDYCLENQIDRIDNDKGYIPGNLQWISAKKNCEKKSSTNIVYWLGESFSLSHWLSLYYDGSVSSGIRKYNDGTSLEDLYRYKNQEGRLKENSKRKSILWVEWKNEKLHFSDFVKLYTKLSYVQANKLRRKGFTLEQLHRHVPRRRCL